jgi:hypothetical protein
VSTAASLRLVLTQEPAEPDPGGLLRRESRSLVQRLRLWTPARYAAAAPPFASRGDLVRHLAQALADRAAELEDLPRRLLPRLDTDLGLADQLAVTADDLVRAQPSRQRAAAAVCHLLLHRHDLLVEPVPPSLAEALVPGGGEAGVLAAGAAACRDSARSPSRSS